MAKEKWYLCSAVGCNIFTGRTESFYHEVPGKLSRLQSYISYIRDQGFSGLVFVRCSVHDENGDTIVNVNFRIYNVPFRGIGRITFQKWGEK